jgi:arylsulfatase A-like enzyme
MQGGNEKSVSVAAITEDLDEGVGRVLESLDQLKLTDSTWVIYMGDNGASGLRGSALRGGKGGVWEGGIRVPFIVRGPGLPPNSWCHTPVVGSDLLPTFCEWAGIPASKIPENVEGGSLAPLLANAGNGEVKRPRDFLVFHFPHYQGADGPQSALLKGNQKLIRFLEDDHIELYDLGRDIGESRDLSQSQASTARQLNEQLTQYLADINAQMPTVNPDYDASVPAPARKGGRNANPSSEDSPAMQGGRAKPPGKGKNPTTPGGTRPKGGGGGGGGGGQGKPKPQGGTQANQ